MSDNNTRPKNRSRGLITFTERDRIRGESEADDAKKYQAISRVRRRIREELPKEMELLEKHHPQLYNELVNEVCNNER